MTRPEGVRSAFFLVAITVYLVLIVAGVVGCNTPKADSPAAQVEDKEPQPGPLPLVLVTDISDSAGLQFFALDPETLADTPGKKPIPAGRMDTALLSPNGSTLAYFQWSGPNSDRGRLFFLDIKTWRGTDAHVRMDGHLSESQMAFTPDGSTLFWLSVDEFPKGENAFARYQLKKYDLRRGSARTLAKLPATFNPREIRYIEKTKRLAVFGTDRDPSQPYLIAGSAKLHFIDANDGDYGKTVELDGVLDGQKGMEPSKNNGLPARLYSAGLAWDLERGKLYVAHADSSAVTAVDLRKQKVIKPPASLSSLSEPWGALFPSAAEAKMVPEDLKMATLRPGGRELLIYGRKTVHESIGRPYEFRERQTIPPVRVFDTKTMKDRGKIDVFARLAAPAPNGDSILLIENRTLDGRPDGVLQQGEAVLLRSGEVMKKLFASMAVGPDGTGGQYNFTGFSADGNSAYLMRVDFSNNGGATSRTELIRIDMKTGKTLASRVLPPSPTAYLIRDPYSSGLTW